MILKNKVWKKKIYLEIIEINFDDKETFTFLNRFSGCNFQVWLKILPQKNFWAIILKNYCSAPHVCRNLTTGKLDEVYLLIVIKSMTGSFARRKAIRDTWGNTDKIPGILEKYAPSRKYQLAQWFYFLM